jgi:hypothetical protein
MGVFFSIPHARPDPVTGRLQHPECYGCLLTFHLRREQDHYKTEKRRLIKEWLIEHDEIANTATWNTTDLSKALEDYEFHNIEQMAANLDQQRYMEKTYGSDPYDKETQERQKPRTARELNNRRGNPLRSPDVVKSKAEEKAYFANDDSYKWHFEFHNKYDGHGHIY